MRAASKFSVTVAATRRGACRARASGMPDGEYVGPIGVFEHDYRNAEKVQAAVRGRQGRCEVKRMHKASAVIIAALRGKKDRAMFKESVQAAETIQHCMRKKQAMYASSHEASQERFRTEALRTIKCFIEAIDNQDVDALRHVVTASSSLVIELQGVTATYKGLRNFLSKAPQATKQALRHVGFDVAPLRLVGQAYTHPHTHPRRSAASTGGEHALIAEATYARDVPVGNRYVTCLEYTVKTANAEGQEPRPAHAEGTAHASRPRDEDEEDEEVPPPRCIVSVHRTTYRKAAHAPTSPDAASTTTGAGDVAADAQQRGGQRVVMAALLADQRSVSLPALGPTRQARASAGAGASSGSPDGLPPLGPEHGQLREGGAGAATTGLLYSHGAVTEAKRQAARGSIYTDPARIEAAVLAASSWADERTPNAQAAGRGQGTGRPDEDEAARTGGGGGALRGSATALPPLSRLPELPLCLQPPETRAIARDRRALSRHLSRQSVGRSGMAWSLEPVCLHHPLARPVSAAPRTPCVSTSCVSSASLTLPSHACPPPPASPPPRRRGRGSLLMHGCPTPSPVNASADRIAPAQAFRHKYNQALRIGTGVRLAPAVKIKVPLRGAPGLATASTLAGAL